MKVGLGNRDLLILLSLLLYGQCLLMMISCDSIQTPVAFLMAVLLEAVTLHDLNHLGLKYSLTKIWFMYLLH